MWGLVKIGCIFGPSCKVALDIGMSLTVLSQKYFLCSLYYQMVFIIKRQVSNFSSNKIL